MLNPPHCAEYLFGVGGGGQHINRALKSEGIIRGGEPDDGVLWRFKYIQGTFVRFGYGKHHMGPI